MLWLLGDDPDQAEVDFVNEALDSGCPVLVMNEGLWEVDKVDENGLFEKLEPSPTQSTTAEINIIETPTETTVANVKVVSSDTDEGTVPVPGADSGPCEPIPAPEPSSYDNLSRSDLKVLIEERGLKADRRSVESMVDALVADDIAQGDGPTAASVAQPDANVLLFTKRPVLGENDENIDEEDQEPDHAHPSLVQSENASVLLLMRQAAETLTDIARLNATLAGVMIQMTKEIVGE